MNRENKCELSEATGLDKKRKPINISVLIAVLFILFYIPRSNSPEPLSETVQSQTEDAPDRGFDGNNVCVDRIIDTANYAADGSSWTKSESVCKRIVRIL